MPKPTVTKLIQALEAHLRTKLLHRTTRRVTVTPDGAAYYERVVRLLADLDELDGSMTLSQASPKGRLRIDVSAVAGAAGHHSGAAGLPRPLSRHPDRPRRHRPRGRPDRRERRLRGARRRADRPVADRPPDRRAAFHHLRGAVLSRRATASRVTPRTSRSDHYVVGYFNPGSGRSFPLSFARDGERYEVDGRYIVSVNDGNAYVGGRAGRARRHAGPDLHGAAAPRHAARCGPCWPDWTSEPMPLHVVYPPNRHLSNKLRVFVDWIADLFAGHRLIRRRAAPAA